MNFKAKQNAELSGQADKPPKNIARLKISQSARQQAESPAQQSKWKIWPAHLAV